MIPLLRPIAAAAPAPFAGSWTGRLAALLCLPLLAGAPAGAQSLRLVAEGHAPGAPVELRVGESLTVHVVADLGHLTAAGIASYLTVPDSAVAVADLGASGQVGTQPFRMGALFTGAHVPTNLQLPESDPVAATLAGRQLDLAVLFGLDTAARARGEGVVATFELVASRRVEGARLAIDDNPVRETKLVLADGHTERRFARTEGLELTIVDPVGSPGASPVALGAWGAVKRARMP